MKSDLILVRSMSEGLTIPEIGKQLQAANAKVESRAISKRIRVLFAFLDPNNICEPLIEARGTRGRYRQSLHQESNQELTERLRRLCGPSARTRATIASKAI